MAAANTDISIGLNIEIDTDIQFKSHNFNQLKATNIIWVKIPRAKT